MIRNFLLNTQMIWIIFTKIGKNTIQIKNEKFLIVFDDIIAHMPSSKKLNPKILIPKIFLLFSSHNLIWLFQKILV